MKNILLAAMLSAAASATNVCAQQVKLLEIEQFDEQEPAGSGSALQPEDVQGTSVATENKEPAAPAAAPQGKKAAAAAKKKPGAAAVKKKNTPAHAAAVGSSAVAAPSAAVKPAKEAAAPGIKPVEIVEFAPRFELQLSTEIVKKSEKPVMVLKPAAVAPKAAAPKVPAEKIVMRAVTSPSAEVKLSSPSVKPVPVSPEATVAPAGHSGFSVEMRHKVNGGDTLWDLSRKYYSNPSKWGKIYNANLNVLRNPDRIYPKEELIIPDITEEVAPALIAATIPGTKPVGEGVTAVAEVKQVSAPAERRIAEVKAAAVSEDLNAFERDTLSTEMPKDQKEWSSRIKVVPADWIEDGIVDSKSSADSVADGLAFSGESVFIRLSSQVKVNNGDYISVYLRGAAAFNRQGKNIGRELQRVAMVEVLSVEGRKIKGRVIDASSPITKGMVVKLSVRQ